ncbi:hypothetical protein ACXWO6_09335, partial [Streptococcus pyogenes]
LSCFRVRRPAYCQKSFVSRIIQKIVGQHIGMNSYTTAGFYLISLYHNFEKIQGVKVIFANATNPLPDLA